MILGENTQFKQGKCKTYQRGGSRPSLKRSSKTKLAINTCFIIFSFFGTVHILKNKFIDLFIVMDN